MPPPRLFQFRFRPVDRRRLGLWGDRSKGSDPGREVSDQDCYNESVEANAQ